MGKIKIEELESLANYLSYSRGARDKALAVSFKILIDSCIKLNKENRSLRSQLNSAEIALRVSKEYIDEINKPKQPKQTKIQFPENNVDCKEFKNPELCNIRVKNYRLCDVCYYNKKFKGR